MSTNMTGFRNRFVLVRRTKVASALEGLMLMVKAKIYIERYIPITA